MFNMLLFQITVLNEEVESGAFNSQQFCPKCTPTLPACNQLLRVYK